MSNRPSWRTATTEGPPTSGRQTRPASAPAQPSCGREDDRSIRGIVGHSPVKGAEHARASPSAAERTTMFSEHQTLLKAQPRRRAIGLGPPLEAGLIRFSL